MRGAWSFASVPLRSECLGFSSGSQREWSWRGATESLNRTIHTALIYVLLTNLTNSDSPDRQTRNQSLQMREGS